MGGWHSTLSDSAARIWASSGRQRADFYGAHIENIDMVLQKTVRFVETRSRQIRIESFNILTHAQFYAPASGSGNISSPNFGQSSVQHRRGWCNWKRNSILEGLAQHDRIVQDKLGGSEEFSTAGAEECVSVRQPRQPDGELSRPDAIQPDSESTTDPDARLARKGTGKEAKLSYTASAGGEQQRLIVDSESPVVDCSNPLEIALAKNLAR
jgi:hypothetical protein